MNNKTSRWPISWDEAFSQQYDQWSAHMTEDIAFYVELARKADGALVELAVGNGRVAIPVAQGLVHESGKERTYRSNSAFN